MLSDFLGFVIPERKNSIPLYAYDVNDLFHLLRARVSAGQTFVLSGSVYKNASIKGIVWMKWQNSFQRFHRWLGQ